MLTAVCTLIKLIVILYSNGYNNVCFDFDLLGNVWIFFL